MPNRKYTVNSSYRYGFNGKENDKDAGEGIQDYGLRIYDGRLGRFLSFDPLTFSYPFYTPYQFAGNDVIRNIDLDGGEPKLANDATTISPTTPKLKVVTTSTPAKVVSINKNIAMTTRRAVVSSLLKKANYVGLFFELMSLQCNPTFVPPPSAEPTPVATPDLNPRAKPKSDDDEDQSELYYIYSTRRSVKTGSELVDEKTSGHIPGTGDLPYYGITKNAVIASTGINGRYSNTSEEAENLKYGGVIGKTNYTTAAGVEMALIALNTYGKDFDSRLFNGKLRLSSVDVRKNTRIDNLKFSNKNIGMLKAGINWLNTNNSDWRNYFYQKENKKGDKHPDSTNQTTSN